MPPKPDTKYSIASLKEPRLLSSPEAITRVEKLFIKRCIKLAWRKTGVMNLQIWWFFFIFEAIFSPSVSNDYELGARKSVLLIGFNDSETTNMTKSIRTMAIVKLLHLKAGHMASLSASQMFSYLARLLGYKSSSSFWAYVWSFKPLILLCGWGAAAAAGDLLLLEPVFLLLLFRRPSVSSSSWF